MKKKAKKAVEKAKNELYILAKDTNRSKQQFIETINLMILKTKFHLESNQLKLEEELNIVSKLAQLYKTASDAFIRHEELQMRVLEFEQKARMSKDFLEAAAMAGKMTDEEIRQRLAKQLAPNLVVEQGVVPDGYNETIR